MAQLKTLRSNEEAHRNSIPWNDIPRSYQDAVRVTRWLDIRYLWIDSLCIIQDDANDWEEKSRKMAVIYGGSHLVIAATQAAGCDEGFLQREEISEPRIVAYDGPTAHRYDSDRGSTENQLVLSPLFQRGWCFQEHMLQRKAFHRRSMEIMIQRIELAHCLALSESTSLVKLKIHGRDQAASRRGCRL